MSTFRDEVMEDLKAICDDEITYLGTTVNVKVFESLDDPSIINQGVSMTYFIGCASDFSNIKKGDKFTLYGVERTVVAFRVNIRGGISVNFK